jgi:hypothetical protein
VGKYQPLQRHLLGLRSSAVRMTFEEVDDLVGGLPSSAGRYRAWWANDGRYHSHANAWLDAGWVVDEVGLGRWVRFRRVASAGAGVSQGGARGEWAASPRPMHAVTAAPGIRAEADPRTTLLVLPCSARKNAGAAAGTSRAMADDLPSRTWAALQRARDLNRQHAAVDESKLMPACERYAGTLYRAAADRIRAAVERGWHILIVSGGYGVVRADEPIGNYNARFRLSRWGARVIGDVLTAYAGRCQLTRAIALAGSTTPYAEAARRTEWGKAGIEAVLLSPVVAGGGAMVKTPRAIGEAVVRLLEGGLPADWASSDGVPLKVERLI